MLSLKQHLFFSAGKKPQTSLLFTLIDFLFEKMRSACCAIMCDGTRTYICNYTLVYFIQMKLAGH